MSRSYIVRTYGCQMNEHDSERISGLLEADGLVRAESEADADVVVLNTCCIRENADNKLYGNLGHLKTWKGEREGRQIVVSGCLAQKDQELVAERAGPRRRGDGHPQRASSRRTARRGPHRRATDHRDPHRSRDRRPGAVPLGAPRTA